MKLAVHDLLFADQGQDNQEVFEATEKLVLRLDEIGYNRYWFAEHHGMDSILSSSPETLVAYFAGKTKNIRLGTGGTMVMHYSPYKVAEVFKTMSYLAPGRIDIGLGRAPGSGYLEIIALAEGMPKQSDQYEKIEQILAFLQDEKPKSVLYADAKAIPERNADLVQPWMLGSTGNSSLRAAKMGLGYSFAKFFSVETPVEVFDNYRKNFVPSAFFEKPELSVSYKVLIADSKDELEYLGKAFDFTHLRQTGNIFSGIPNPEEVKDYEFTNHELDKLKHDYDKRFIIKGTKDEVASILEEEADLLKFDELLVFSPIFGIDNRIKSYELLKEIFD